MSFQPFTTVVGPAAALLQPNIDTDVIIRVDHLTKSRSEVGPFAFEALRFQPNGQDNPDFPFNLPAFRGAPFLLAGPNFGCGSSREPAVWALAGLGVRCVIGTTFGDIFFANCAQNGLLVISVPASELNDIVAATREGEPLIVNLPEQTIHADAHGTWSFDILPGAKQSLLHGLDDLELALADAPLIDAWQAADRSARPWVWKLPTSPPDVST